MSKAVVCAARAVAEQVAEQVADADKVEDKVTKNVVEDVVDDVARHGRDAGSCEMMRRVGIVGAIGTVENVGKRLAGFAGQWIARAQSMTPEQLHEALQTLWRTSRNGLAGNVEYMRRQHPVPARLLLTLALPAVTTLILMQLVPAIQESRANGCQSYTVQPGDTLSKIGARFGESVADLVGTNHIANPDLIFVGQRLCISSTTSPVNGTITNDPNMRATGEQAFVTAILPYAQQASQQVGWPVSLILAQWGLEQGWKTPGYTGFNFGNVAALPGEPTVGGIQKAGSPAAFAYATSPADGVRYYVHVAQLGYYSGVASTARASGVDAAARALGRSPWDAGHYTNHGDPGSSLLMLLQKYNLYVYDA